LSSTGNKNEKDCFLVNFFVGILNDVLGIDGNFFLFFDWRVVGRSFGIENVGDYLKSINKFINIL
jgi:hypothetical protein